MDTISFIKSSLQAEEKYFTEAITEITYDELQWQPASKANHINWIIWHMSRVEDMWFNFFCNNNLEIWETQGWFTHFNLPTRDNGFGHTDEQVKSFPPLDLQDLLKYRAEVRIATLNYLSSLSEIDLETIPREKRPDMAVSDVFVQIINELFQHIGHIFYIRGLFNS